MIKALQGLLVFLTATILMVILVTLTFLGATVLVVGLGLWALLDSGV